MDLYRLEVTREAAGGLAKEGLAMWVVRNSWVQLCHRTRNKIWSESAEMQDSRLQACNFHMNMKYPFCVLVYFLAYRNTSLTRCRSVDFISMSEL
jgi:hypothetical protein